MEGHSISIIQQPEEQHGYVWDAEGAVDLRRKHRLLGSYLGGVANFKSQNIVSGLPLQLGSDEVQLAVSQGWAQVLPPSLHGQQPVLAPLPTLPDSNQGGTSGTTGNMYNTYNRKRRRGGNADADDTHVMGGPYWLTSYYEYYQGLGMYNGEGEGTQQGEGTPASLQGGSSAVQLHPGQQQGRAGGAAAGVSGGGGNGRGKSSVPGWLRNAYWLKLYYEYYDSQGAYVEQGDTSGGGMHVAGTDCAGGRGPDGAQGTMVVDGEGDQEKGSPEGEDGRGEGKGRVRTLRMVVGSEGGVPGGEEPWKAAVQDGAPYIVPIQAPTEQPSQPLQPPGAESQDPLKVARQRVFADLHSKGYALTPGPKFGSDLLAYPGDPCLFHAQFTVRIAPPEKPLAPLALKAAARGSHAARKHLLLAALPKEGGDQADVQPMYITVAPEAGFGK